MIWHYTNLKNIGQYERKYMEWDRMGNVIVDGDFSDPMAIAILLSILLVGEVCCVV